MTAKLKPVRHYRNGPGIDVCFGCGARGHDLLWSMTVGGITCAAAKKKVREKRTSPAGSAAWAAKMRKVTLAKLRERGWA